MEFIEYVQGNVPIVLSAPHGGRDETVLVPDRKEGCHVNDFNTEELAKAICNNITRVYTEDDEKRKPYLIVNHLKRAKMDPNRPCLEATENHPLGVKAWERYHGCIHCAVLECVNTFGCCHVFDIHGQSHRDAVELGYLLSPDDLDLLDEELDEKITFSEKSSLHRLIQHRKVSDGAIRFSSILRGSQSLGRFLVNHGYAAVPSPQEPSPKNPYFSGAYTTRRNGNVYGVEGAPKMDGVVGSIQIETHDYVRKKPHRLEKFAKAMANSIAQFMEANYGVTKDSVRKASDGTLGDIA